MSTALRILAFHLQYQKIRLACQATRRSNVLCRVGTHYHSSALQTHSCLLLRQCGLRFMIMKIKRNKKYMKVLLTVPHATCDTSQIRTCDKRALEAAKLLYNEFSKKEPTNQTVLYTNQDIPRRVIDMNRLVSRGTPWRMKLSKLLRDTHFDLVIDVHSFPDSHKWGKKEHLAFEFLYDLPTFPQWLRDLMFNQNLRYPSPISEIPRVNIDYGTTNDIMDEILDLNHKQRIPTNVFLLEVNEDDHVLPVSQLQRRIQDLVSFLTKYGMKKRNF